MRLSFLTNLCSLPNSTRSFVLMPSPRIRSRKKKTKQTYTILVWSLCAFYWQKGSRARDLEDETASHELSFLPLITGMKVRDTTVHNCWLAGWHAHTQLQSFLPHRQTVKCTCIRSGMNNRSRHQSGGLSLQLSMPRVWAQRSWKFLPLSLCPAKATLYLLAALSETQERRVRGGMNVS